MSKADLKKWRSLVLKPLEAAAATVTESVEGKSKQTSAADNDETAGEAICVELVSVVV